MSTIIVKVEPDVDYYVLYSTVTDGFGHRGARDFMIEILLDPKERNDERFARADEYGSSAQLLWGEGQWEVEGFIVSWDNEGENEVGPRWLPRKNLKEWLTTGDESLVEPITD